MPNNYLLGDKPRISVTDWGGTGRPILLVHGLAGNSHWWDLLAPKLLPALRPIAFDFRGHGDSEWTQDGRYDMAGFLQDIGTVKSELKLNRFILCGHSTGARVSAAFAAHSRDLNGFIGIDFMPEADPIRSHKFQRIRRRAQPVYPSIDAMIRHFRLEPSGTLLGQNALEALARQCIKPTPGGFTWKFDWKVFQFIYPTVWPDLPHIQCPSLLIRGGLSPIMPAEVFKKALLAIPDGQGLEFQGVHHHLSLDDPDRLATEILRFAARIDKP